VIVSIVREFFHDGFRFQNGGEYVLSLLVQDDNAC